MKHRNQIIKFAMLIAGGVVLTGCAKGSPPEFIKSLQTCRETGIVELYIPGAGDPRNQLSASIDTTLAKELCRGGRFIEMVEK